MERISTRKKDKDIMLTLRLCLRVWRGRVGRALDEIEDNERGGL